VPAARSVPRRTEPCPAATEEPPGFEPFAKWCRPERLAVHVAAAGTRYGTDDPAVAAALVGKEVLAAATHRATAAWYGHRRVPDLAPANVLVGSGPDGLTVALARERMFVLPGDPLAGRADVEVRPTVEELFAELRARWLDGLVAAVVAAVRAVARVPRSPLWGTVALAVINDLAAVVPVLDPHGELAGERNRLVAGRPELAPTVEVVSVATTATPVSFAIRRTCCRLSETACGLQCSTCPKLDRDDRVADLGEWYRQVAAAAG
jgi:hypothetical protein